RLENKRLFVEAGGKEIGLLDDKYKLGVMFKVDITATAQGIRVMYNGQKKVNYKKTGSKYYFKAGCYTQSAKSSRNVTVDSFGEVVIYKLVVSHTL
ncbi:polysaccharide lyase family 7 protein, partial [Candidatus Saccharibacteria bacterium]|nr:polysaccharide lyase family 7 protein [Candidatus Saccharibacteria bacterium]